jgi:hypothetical protein
VGDPTNVSAVPTGQCADVFRSYTTALMNREGIPVTDFSDVDYPQYEPYDDEYYHVHNYYVRYYTWAEIEAKRKQEEEERKRAEQAANNSSASAPSGNRQ